MFQRDVEYIVQDGQVVLIDEHTGRTMPGRRLSEGLHQAIEAKEEPDFGLDDFPKLLPPIRQVGWHDGYGGHRGF